MSPKEMCRENEEKDALGMIFLIQRTSLFVIFCSLV